MVARSRSRLCCVWATARARSCDGGAWTFCDVRIHTVSLAWGADALLPADRDDIATEWKPDPDQNQNADQAQRRPLDRGYDLLQGGVGQRAEPAAGRQGDVEAL